MAKYRKKAKEVDAVQWFKDGDHPAVFMQTEPTQVFVRGQFYVNTHLGQELVREGEWIVTFDDGKHRRYSDIAFKDRYEAV
ncbi:hypothetical protein D3C87_1422710 [compost metagenome]